MKGILFKPEMIQAIVEGRKTVTRRVIKPQPIIAQTYKGLTLKDLEYDGFKPRYQIGETVYIKEAGAWDNKTKFRAYKANMPDTQTKWQSPLLMPEWAARYFVLIKDVRAERLQEIAEQDAKAEGATPIYESTPTGYYFDFAGYIRGFHRLWDSINKDYPWESNPWVFRYEFEYQSKENV